MARRFNGTNQYLSKSGAALSGMPCTIACWFNPDLLTADYVLASCGNGGGANGGYFIQFAGSIASDPVRAVQQTDGGGNGIATVNTSFAAGTWHHAAGVYVSTTSRTAYIDGTAGTENTTSTAAPTPDFTSIGANRRSSVTGFTAGAIAETGFWNVDLTASEILTLAKGVSPLLVRPASLVEYYPLFARATDEESWRGGVDGLMTNTNTATAESHPARIFYPARPRFMADATVGGTAQPPRTMHQFQMRRAA